MHSQKQQQQQEVAGRDEGVEEVIRSERLDVSPRKNVTHDQLQLT